MASATLTEEQKRRIAENKAKALARRAERNNNKELNISGPNINANKQSSEFSFYCSAQNISNDTEDFNKKPGPSWVGVRYEQNSRYGNSSAIVKNVEDTNHQQNVKSSSVSTVSNRVSQLDSSGKHYVQKMDPNRTVHFSAQILGSKGSNITGCCVLVSRERFEVRVGFFDPLVEIFKQMKTKIYDPSSRIWSFKLEEYYKLMKAVESLKPHVTIEALPKVILQTFSSQLKGDYPDSSIPPADLSKVDQDLVNALMPFQREGVNFAIAKNGRVLLADDMGLGKTIQAIAVADFYRSSWPLLVVCPSSVRFDWAQQIQRWLPKLDPQQINIVINGKSSSTSGLVNITSYDLMARKAEELSDKNFKIIIMDECHFLKNYRTVRTKAALPILQKAKYVLLLSGTPALSRPLELYTQISAVAPFIFKFHEFGVRYCDGKQNQWGWDFTGSSNMKELQLLLEEKIMIRRQKKDVLTQLPDKFRQMVLLNPQSITVNKNLKTASSIMNLKNLKGIEWRGALLNYFHQTCTAKVKAVREYILDMLEGDKKILVFAHHQEMLGAVEEVVKDGVQYIRIDGKTSSEQRNTACRRFQTDPNVKIAILSITAANAGLDLSAASVVIFAELFWNPGILVQAEDRAHRMGQLDSVNVHYLVAKGTADDFIWPLVQTKLDVLSKAGLTKDNFSEADTTHQKDSKMQEIMHFFEESFIEIMSDECEKREESSRPKKKSREETSKLPTCKTPVKKSKPSPHKTPEKPAKIVPITKYFSTVENQHGIGCDIKDEDLKMLVQDMDWEEDF